MNINPAPSIERLKAFDICSPTYKQVNNHNVTVDVLIPKETKPGKHPTIVRFHGGFLIFGSSLFPGTFPPWIMDFALKYSAIVVSPNYLKLPESNGSDILRNISDFWQWFHKDLQTVVRWATTAEVEVDQSKTLVIGHSAGGYLAVQSAITQPAGSIRAVVAGYPMLDFKAPWYTKSFAKFPFGRPMESASIVDDHLAAMKTGDVVSAVNPPARFPLAVATVQHGRYPEILGSDASLYPLETIGTVESFPNLFVYHGKNDSAVPAEGTKKFVEKFKLVLPECKVLMKIEAGDHGFDIPVGLETPWMKEGLTFVTDEWLR